MREGGREGGREGRREGGSERAIYFKHLTIHRQKIDKKRNSKKLKTEYLGHERIESYGYAQIHTR